MTSKSIGVIIGFVLAILFTATPIYASETASFQWTDDTFRLEGYQTDSSGTILPDAIVFYNASDGFTEINVGGGRTWRFGSSTVLAEGYLAWRDTRIFLCCF